MTVTNYNTVMKPNEVSIFIPHIDMSYGFQDIVYQLQDLFELGKIDRIEALPRVNQVDGHPYLACFVYFWKWGNGYLSQQIYNNMKQNTPTRLYLNATGTYWIALPNTSHVADVPLPEHISFYLVHDPKNVPTKEQLVDVFDKMNIGRVSYNHTEYLEGDAIRVVMDYWYHSKTTFDIQSILKQKQITHLHVNPDVDLNSNTQVLFSSGELDDDWTPNMYWTLAHDDEDPPTTGANPYLWYAREVDHPLNINYEIVA